MQKFLIFLVLALSSGAAYATQLDQTAAVNRVLALLPPGDVTDDLEISIGKPDNNTFLLVADPTPNANWGHKVYYYYMPAEYTGSTPTVSKTETQYWLPKNVALSKIYYNEDNENELVYPFIERPVTTRDVPAATHQYAIIISGGLNRNYNYSRYWNDCSYIYRVMRKYYNVPKENIYLAMSDGTDPGYDMASGSQNLDLDADGVNDIEYAATLEDLGIIFNSLKEKLTPNDHLFIYVIDHGGYDEQLQSSYICLWNEESLYPDDLNAWLDELTVGSINCVFGQCFSGGFIDPLISENRIIATACAEDESSWASSNKRYDAFVEAWTTGLMNVTKFNEERVQEADSDNDGFVNMMEAFQFAEFYDECGPQGEDIEHPDFFALNDVLAKDLCFDRHPAPFELIIRDDINDVGIEPNVSAPVINNSPDIWVRRKNDNKTEHQNPICTTKGETENYIYVRVTNKGLYDYDPKTDKRYLHVNWAIGAAGNTYMTFTGQYRDSNLGTLGSAVQSIFLDQTIPAGGEYIACIPWRTHGYTSELEESPKSILATISDKPYGLAYDVTRKFYPTISSSQPGIKSRYYKNIAIKNASAPIQIANDSCSWNIAIQGLDGSQKAYSVHINKDGVEDPFDYVTMTVYYPDGLQETMSPLPKSQDANRPISRVVINDVTEKTFYFGDESIRYFILNPNQIGVMRIKAEPKSGNNFTGKLSAALKIREYPTDEIVGSYSMNFAMSRGVFNLRMAKIIVSENGGNAFCLKPDETTLAEAEEIKWLDENDNVISTDDVLNLETNQTQRIKLSVRMNDNSIEDASVVINPTCKIVSAHKNADGNITVKLNSVAEKGLKLSAYSIDKPYLSFTADVEEGNTTAIMPGAFFDNEIIILSLEKDGSIISSFTLRHGSFI